MAPRSPRTRSSSSRRVPLSPRTQSPSPRRRPPSVARSTSGSHRRDPNVPSPRRVPLSPRTRSPSPRRRPPSVARSTSGSHRPRAQRRAQRRAPSVTRLMSGSPVSLPRFTPSPSPATRIQTPTRSPSQILPGIPPGARPISPDWLSRFGNARERTPPSQSPIPRPHRSRSPRGARVSRIPYWQLTGHSPNSVLYGISQPRQFEPLLPPDRLIRPGINGSRLQRILNW